MLSNRPCVIGKRLQILETEFNRAVISQEKPVTAPGYVAGNSTISRNVNAKSRARTIARHIANRYGVIAVQLRFHYSHGSFYAVRARLNPPCVRQSHSQTDRPMAAHVEKADVVEEDHAGRTGRVRGITEQGADYCVGSARLIDYC